MADGKSQRRLSNVKLTRTHHFRYMGLWVLLTSVLIVVVNYFIFRSQEQQWENESALAAELVGKELVLRKPVIAALTVETVLLIVAVTYLGMFTAHRVAGPYIRLRNVCNQIADGDTTCELRFRQYDRLDEVSNAFNRMLRTLRAGRPAAGGDAQDGKSTG